MIESHPSDFTSVASRSEPERRSGKSVGIIVLLSFLTLANVIALLMVGASLASAMDHGDEEFTRLLTFSMVTTVVGLVGIGGGWATQKWGPRLYLAAVVVDRIVALVAFPGFFPVVAIVGIVPAVGLVSTAERNW